MADLLIRDVEIPKKGNIGILIYADGSAEVCGTGSWSKPVYGTPTTKAIEVPPHGDLKDANKILQWLNRICDEWQSVSVGEIIDYIENAKTVIEASN